MATDAMDTCPMSDSQVEKATMAVGSVPSPDPSNSPEITSDERRTHYQQLSKPCSPASECPSSTGAVAGSPDVKPAGDSKKKKKAMGG